MTGTDSTPENPPTTNPEEMDEYSDLQDAIPERYLQEATHLANYVSENCELIQTPDFQREIQLEPHHGDYVIDMRSYVFPPEALRRMLMKVDLKEYQWETHTDAVHIAGELAGFLPRINTIADKITLHGNI